MFCSYWKLQHLLTQVNYYYASGINGVEWDAVELPSQFMGNWCYHKPTLMGLTKHQKSYLRNYLKKLNNQNTAKMIVCL